MLAGCLCFMRLSLSEEIRLELIDGVMTEGDKRETTSGSQVPPTGRCGHTEGLPRPRHQTQVISKQLSDETVSCVVIVTPRSLAAGFALRTDTD